MPNQWAASPAMFWKPVAAICMYLPRRALLPACALLLLTACGGAPTTEEQEQEAFDDLRTEIRDTIEDSDRQAAVIGVVDELQVGFTELRKLAQERRQKLRALNRNYDASRDEFTALLDEFAVQRTASQAEFQKVRATLKENCTPEEWASIEKTNTKAMASLARLISAI